MFDPNQCTLKMSIILLSCAVFVSCKGGNASSSFGSSSDTLSNITPIAGSSSGIVETSKLFVGVDSTSNAFAHVHQSNSFDLSCSVDPNTASPKQDIDCIIDIPEAELYHRGLNIVYNVPPSMCNYLRRSTYWFYNVGVGYGPSTIVITRTITDGVVTASTCNVDGGGAGPCATVSNEVVINPVTLEATCIYDRTKINSGKNGCFGNYTRTVTDTTVVTTPFSSNVGPAVVTQQSWGGAITNVIGGAAKNTAWPMTPVSGLPMALVAPSVSGILKENYKLPAPITSNNQTSNVDIANYYDPALHTHQGFSVVRTSTLPYFIDPVDDISGSAIPLSLTTTDIALGRYLVKAQDTYEFECLDQAQEVKHRIRVKVREWDVYQDFVNFITSKGTDASAVPDRFGTTEDAGACEGVSGPCNDMYDIDDIINVDFAGALYDTTGTGVAKRPFYFPDLRKD